MKKPRKRKNSGKAHPKASESGAKPQLGAPTHDGRAGGRGRLAVGTAVKAIALAVGAIGLLSGLHDLLPLIVPSDPDIRAQNTMDGSPGILPFEISMQSAWLIPKTLTLSCYVNLAYVMDADRRPVLLRDAAYTEGAVGVQPNFSYYCDSKILTLTDDGALVMGFPHGQHFQTQPGRFRPPLKVLKLCVEVTGNYSTLGFSRAFKSAMFQWPADPTHFQWIKGPIAFDDDSQWIPKDSKPPALYGMRQLFDNGQLTRGALTCDAP